MYLLIGVLGLVVIFVVFVATAALGRWAAAGALGMRGVTLFFGGAIEDPRAAAGWRRALVVLAGAGASYLVPAMLFTVAFLGSGKPMLSTEVTVVPGKPAEAAGMRTGDRMRSVGGQPVAEWEEAAKAIREHGGSPVEIVVERAGDEVRVTVTPAGPPGEGRIGVAAAGKPERVPVGFGEALGRGLAGPAGVMRDVVKGVITTAAGQTSSDLSGPVGIVREASGPTATGGSGLTFFAAILSYLWPVAALLAAATVPRRAKARG